MVQYCLPFVYMVFPSSKLISCSKCDIVGKVDIQGVPKKVQHEKTIFLNMKITKFEITMNIIMWSNLLSVLGFFPVNFGASVNKS